MRKIFFALLVFGLAANLYAAPPSRTYTYTTGEIIDPAKVTQNEDNIYNYLTIGVDTFRDGTIVDADLSNTAAISYSKLSLNNSIVNADISTSAAIVYSKLSLGSSLLTGDIKDGEIVNADINASAAIVDTKLAQITTASKVSGASVTSLSSIPSGAGQVPVANLGTGTGSSSNFLRGDGSWQTVSITKASLGLDSGSVAVNATSSANVNFSFTYNSAPIVVVSQYYPSGIPPTNDCYVTAVSTTGFTVYNSNGVNTTIYWISMGTPS
jgi:hypothetical protein